MKIVKAHTGKIYVDVYIVKPIGQYFNTINTEYIADKALILDKSPTV